MLINLGCNKSDAKMIIEAIMNFIQKGVPFKLGGGVDDNENKRLKDISGKHGDNMKDLKE